MEAAGRPERDHRGMRCAVRLPLSAARSRYQVHPVLPSDHCVRSSRAAGVARAQPEPECLTALDGEAPKRAVVQVWDSMEKIQAWRSNPEYKELRKVGDKYAKFRSYTVEGLPQ
jgi:hypothetical protein